MAQVVTDAVELRHMIEAGAAIGKKPHQIKPENFYEHKGPMAEALQMSLEALHPDTAAKQRKAAVGLSAGAVLAKQGAYEMTPEIHQELITTDPEYREQRQKEQADRESELLASWEARTAEMQAARGIKPDAPQGPNDWRSRWASQQQAMTKAGL